MRHKKSPEVCGPRGFSDALRHLVVDPWGDQRYLHCATNEVRKRLYISFPPKEQPPYFVFRRQWLAVISLSDDGREFGKAVAPNRAPPESRVSEGDIKEISQ